MSQTLKIKHVDVMDVVDYSGAIREAWAAIEEGRVSLEYKGKAAAIEEIQSTFPCWSAVGHHEWEIASILIETRLTYVDLGLDHICGDEFSKFIINAELKGEPSNES